MMDTAPNQKDTRRLIRKNAVFNVIKAGITLMLPVAVFPYVSRALGPVSLGSVDFASAVVSYFLIFASMGIPAYGRIACAKARQNELEFRKTVCELLYLHLTLEAITYAALLLSIFLIPRFYPYRVLLLLNSLSVLVSAINLEWLHGALERFRYIAVRAIVLKAVCVALVFVMIHSPEDSIKYTAINELTLVVSALLDFFLARKHIHFYRVSELNFRRHFAPIFMFFASSVAITINSNTDTVMLTLLGGEYQTGLYTFSARVKTTLVLLMVAGLDVVVPRLSMFFRAGQHDDFRALIRSTWLLTFTIGCAMTSYFMVFSRETACILGGENYAPAASAITVLMLCIPVMSVTFTLGVGVLQVIGREKLYARTMLISCLINIAANYVLIPRFYATGAALATLLSEIVIMLLYYRYARDYIQNAYTINPPALIAGAAIAAGGVCWFGKAFVLQGHPLLQMIVFLVVYLIIYCPIVCAVSREIKEFALNLLSRKGF